MNDLLETALSAHGGLKCWSELNTIKVAATIIGAIWFVKGQGDYLEDVVITSNTKTQKVVTEFPGQDKRFIFETSKVVMERVDGTPIQTRYAPEKHFADHKRETPWDDLHVAYFQGEALWTYLTTPFLYTYQGFVTEEISPIQVDGETWRRLKVVFPDHVKSHTREQISCFGPDGLLRRHDYTVDILGGSPGLNYASEYREVGQILIPTRRRVYPYEGDYQPVTEPLLVSIDMGEITVA